MQLEAFEAQLAQTGTYRTPDRPERILPDRLLGRSDLWYYLRLTATVTSAACFAVRGRLDDRLWALHSIRCLRGAEGCGGHFEISGVDRLSRLSGPVVYVCNHMSLLETVILPCVLLQFHGLTIVVKESLLRYPIFGAVMRAVKPISVTRRDARQDFKQILTQGQASLAAGRSVLIFPQSTRLVEFDPARFNSAGVKLAARAGVPVVPIAVKTDFMGIGRRLRDFGPINRHKRIHICVGEIIQPGEDTRHAHALAIEHITRNLLAWGGTIAGSA